MRRSAGSRVLGRLVASTLVVGALSVVGLSSSVGASAVGAVPSAVDGQPFYLDLGGSASVGVQPTVAYPKGQRTDEGYANDLVNYEAAHGVDLQLTEMGCPSETTINMLTGGDTCYALHETQLRDALDFLHAHDGDPGLVTLDIGFNNLRPCFVGGAVNEACVNAGLDTLRTQLTFIVNDLEAAADPDVTLVGIGHYDPFLADALNGDQGTTFALASASMIARLNATLSRVYRRAGVPMATVGSAFSLHDSSLVNVAGEGEISANVAETCELTWMCAPAPYGPNIHPNAAGYQAIASAIEDALKAPF